MNFTVILDWKSLAVLGLSAIGLTLAGKLGSEQAKEVSICAIDAFKMIGNAKLTDY